MASDDDRRHSAILDIELNASAFTDRGTPAFTQTMLAMFAAGFATFALLYCVQPLMPEFSRDFGVSAAGSSLSLSLTTGLLSVAMLVASAVSERWGRKPVMLASLLASSLLTFVVAAAPAWHQILFARALMGITLSGLPAVAMAYVGEEMHPRSIGLAMGLYISGSGLGGMAGRLLTGVLTDAYGWRMAVATMGGLGLVAAILFWRSLPPSRHFRARTPGLGAFVQAFAVPFRDRALPWLFAEGFLLMGSFVTVYNYIGYRLLAPPFSLSQTSVGILFSVYLIGIFSSAWMGSLADRLGRRHVLWTAFAIMLAGALLTLSNTVWVIVTGIAVLTFGFFGGHSIASAWVGNRAQSGRAHAASLYLFAYYAGSSVIGTLGGIVWTSYGWNGIAALDAALLATALLIAFHLSTIPPRSRGA